MNVPGDDARPPLNEPGFRENAVQVLLTLLAVSIRISETLPDTGRSAKVRDEMQYRLRESPALGRLTVLERQHFDEMVFFLETALESDELRVADEASEGHSH